MYILNYICHPQQEYKRTERSNTSTVDSGWSGAIGVLLEGNNKLKHNKNERIITQQTQKPDRFYGTLELNCYFSGCRLLL